LDNAHFIIKERNVAKQIYLKHNGSAYTAQCCTQDFSEVAIVIPQTGETTYRASGWHHGEKYTYPTQIEKQQTPDPSIPTIVARSLR